jgi:predicted TPR repeat methyltransferase
MVRSRAQPGVSNHGRAKDGHKLRMSTGPLFVSSGDAIADRRYKFALDYAARGDFPGAVEVLMQAVELAPAFATAWFALGAMRDRLGDRTGAIAAFEKARDADPEDYHGARLHLERLGAAASMPEMTATYVRRLFDHHAPSFDESLVGRLGYRGPELLHEAVRKACESVGRPMQFAAMLDLGCGTGLAGMAFRPHVAHLVGVDLSPRMIARAQERQVYDRLEVGDLNTSLTAQAAAGTRCDLVIAADVFVYMADFPGACAKVARVLMPDGLFGFTMETHASTGMILGETLRYAHARTHVDAALAQAGLRVFAADPDSIRTEKGVPVPSLVVVAGHN